MKTLLSSLLGGVLWFFSVSAWAEVPAAPVEEKFTKGADSVEITLFGHASLGFRYQGQQIYVDPVSAFMRGDSLPPADIILITHEHSDHLDSALLSRLSKADTVLITNERSRKILGNGNALANGQKIELPVGFSVQAVPAYNTSAGKQKYHPKGRDNGYVLNLGSIRVYVAGDTEDVPEMADLTDVDVGFFPVNQPYTMTPQQAAKAIRLISPKVAYPYHLGDTDLTGLREALEDFKETQIKIFDLK